MFLLMECLGVYVSQLSQGKKEKDKAAEVFDKVIFL